MLRQRVVGGLALASCGVGGIGSGGQDARSVISAAEHVGKHSDGIGGCRADRGRGGMIEGETPGIDQPDVLLAQPVSSCGVASRIGASRRQLRIVNTLALLLALQPAQRFSDIGLGSGSGGQAHFGVAALVAALLVMGGHPPPAHRQHDKGD